MIDVCRVEIDDSTLLGPAVQIYSANHPLEPGLREAGWESGKPVRIGRNCWIGGGAIIVPGVSLGDNVVVAAGSVVTKSFGDGVLLAGNPAKVIKRIAND